MPGDRREGNVRSRPLTFGLSLHGGGAEEGVGQRGVSAWLRLRHVFYLPVPEATERTPLAGAVPLLEDAPRLLGGRVLLGERAGALGGTQLREAYDGDGSGLLEVYGARLLFNLIIEHVVEGWFHLYT